MPKTFRCLSPKQQKTTSFQIFKKFHRQTKKRSHKIKILRVRNNWSISFSFSQCQTSRQWVWFVLLTLTRLLLCLPHSVISFEAINFSSISQLFVFTPDFIFVLAAFCVWQQSILALLTTILNRKDAGRNFNSKRKVHRDRLQFSEDY